MKKRMISLCIMLTAMTVSMRAGVKIDATHFPDANFRKCLSDKRIDKNQDGYLNDEELDAVKELNLNNKGIKDLKGIEYFQELRELECHENELTSIDVSMQYNLKWFDCSNNKLTTLDVSRNPVLGALYCFSNKLTALDVSKNKYLVELFIAGNQIQGQAMHDLVRGMHDVNEGTAEFGVCFNGVSPDNIITVPQVNLAKDAGWRVTMHNGSGWVDYAGVSPGIAITATNFPDDNFRKYISTIQFDKNQDGFLSDEEIHQSTEFALSKKNIKNLKGLEFFTNLMDLECANNSLTSLDITKNTELTRLDCSDNQIKSLDLSKNTKLREVFCLSNKLTALDLSKNKNLGWLWIAGNQIQGDAMLNLVTSLPDRYDPMGELYVCMEGASPDNVITTLHVGIARDARWRVMRYNGSKWEDYNGVSMGLPITSTNFPDDNFRNIVESKAIDRDLNGFLSDDEIKITTELALSKKNIKNLKGLEFFTNLMDLECANNSLTSLDITKNTELTRLDCSDNQIKSLDLSKNTKLMEVFCLSNKLTALDLSKNKNLGWLWIAGNQIQGDAMLNLVTSLPDRYDPMGELYVCMEGASPDNVITTLHVGIARDARWRVMRYNGSKWEDYDGVSMGIDITATNFPDENFRNIVESKAIDRDLNGFLSDDELKMATELALSKKDIKDLKGLEFFTYLMDLECANNSLTSLDITKNTELTRLDCSYNSLTSLDLSKNTKLREVLCFSNKLTALDLSNNKNLGWLWIAGNQIMGDAMLKLVLSLPDRTEPKGQLAVCVEGASPDNVITTQQVSLAKDRGWRVLMLGDTKWEDFDGVSLGLDINATNFPDAFFRSVVSGKEIDLNQDGYLSDAELAITSLDVTGKNIKDLKGIEFFTALTQLWCSANELTSLDVSKNTALTLLYCNVNNLTSLDVSNNTALITLNCADNYLVSLDVSKNLALTELYCQGNDIAEGGMDLLINSLPIANGVLYVSMKGNSPENVITVEQVKTANDKGWKVMGSNGEEWVEFTPDGITSIYNSGDSNGVWYNLNGQRVEKPGKGIYIQNGKKVIIGR